MILFLSSMMWNKENDQSIYELNMQLHYIMRNDVPDNNTAEKFKDVIKNLINNGANINFQNINCDNDTPLHTAVKSKNLCGATALLGFNPYTDIKNKNNKTSEDLAMANNDEWQQLLALHRNNFPEELIYINKACIGEVQGTQKLNNSRIQILRILECDTTAKALQRMQSKDLKYHNKNCFVFILKILNYQEPDENKLKKLMESFKRPVIIQLINSKLEAKTGIYYMDNDKSMRKIQPSNSTEEIKFGISLDIQLLLQGCIHGVCGSLEGELTNINLKFRPILGFLVGQSLQQNNLCLRFFSLFRNFLDEKIPIAFIIANIKSTRTVESILKLALRLDENASEEKLFEKLQQRIKKEGGGCPIMISVEQDNVEVLKYFLEHPKGNTLDAAATLAFKKKHFQCLAELITTAEARFPFKFDVNNIEDDSSRKRIEEFVDENKQFLELIAGTEVGKEKEVNRIIDENRNKNRKTYYDYDNNSALAVSWPYQSIYSALVAKHFKIGNFLKFDEILRNDSCWLVDKQTDWFKEPTESHLNILLLKFRIRNDDDIGARKNRIKFAKDFCLLASKSKEFSKILEVISCHRKLTILLDCKYPLNFTSSTILPLADYSSDFIHVPAMKDENNRLIQSALIYKLTSNAIKEALNENLHSFPENDLYTNIKKGTLFSSDALAKEAAVCRAMQLKVTKIERFEPEPIKTVFEFVAKLKFRLNGKPINSDSKALIIVNAPKFLFFPNRFRTHCP